MERFFREEMIRTYVKQIIIRATRKWKKQNLDNDEPKNPNQRTRYFSVISATSGNSFQEKA
jgi:hypothetical protein